MIEFVEGRLLVAPVFVTGAYTKLVQRMEYTLLYHYSVPALMGSYWPDVRLCFLGKLTGVLESLRGQK